MDANEKLEAMPPFTTAEAQSASAEELWRLYVWASAAAGVDGIARAGALETTRLAGMEIARRLAVHEDRSNLAGALSKVHSATANDLVRAREKAARFEQVIGELIDWSHEGACSPGSMADTFGEGLQAAKRHVLGIINNRRRG